MDDAILAKFMPSSDDRLVTTEFCRQLLQVGEEADKPMTLLNKIKKNIRQQTRVKPHQPESSDEEVEVGSST